MARLTATTARDYGETVSPEEHGRDRETRRAYEDVFVRKGSIAAFMAAVRRYDAAAPESLEAVHAAADIELLLAVIKALGVLEVFAVKSARARLLLRSLDPDLPL